MHTSVINQSFMSGLPRPFAVDYQIVAEVDRRLSVIDELETVVTDYLQHTTRLRESVLQEAFATGLQP